MSVKVKSRKQKFKFKEKFFGVLISLSGRLKRNVDKRNCAK